MARWRDRTSLIAALLVAAALVAACGTSAAGDHPTVEPDVGTNSPTTGPGGSPSSGPTGNPTDGLTGESVTCPASFGQLQPANGPVTPPVTGPGTLGVSSGIRQVLVCSYSPFTSTSPATLRWSRTLEGAPATALLAVVDEKVQRQADLIGPINCPRDNGSAAILRFTYAAQATQDVLVRLTGCRPASSEHGTTMFRDDIARAVEALH